MMYVAFLGVEVAMVGSLQAMTMQSDLCLVGGLPLFISSCLR